MSSSDYRGSCQNGSNDTTQKSLNDSSTEKMNYAEAINTETFPKKDQAIILDSIPGSTIEQYILEIAKMTDPTNIRFVSRISGNRVCIYLASKKIADDLIQLKKQIILHEIPIKIRPLINRAKRVIFSNVCPVIPHSVLEKELRNLNIKLESKISFVKVGLAEKGLTHIMSFRRQVYVNPEDLIKIPDTFKVMYEDTAYWIYATSDSLTCFICKKEGHVAKQCTQTENIMPAPIDDNNYPQLSQENNINNNKMVNTVVGESDARSMNVAEILPDPNKAVKIPLSETNSTVSSLINAKQLSSSESSLDSLSLIKDKNVYSKHTTATKMKNPSKKSKADSTGNKNIDYLEEKLLPIKNIIENAPTEYPLDYLQFKSFMDKALSTTMVDEIAKEYSNNVEEIANMMRALYPHLETRSIKSRFTRIIKKIETNLSLSNSAEHTANNINNIED